MQDQIYDMLMKRDEITWQSLIYELVRSEQMNPWDIDVGLLARRYLETLKKMKEMNFFISGKVVLASAILLKIKSYKLVEEDISNLDSILFKNEREYDVDLTEEESYEEREDLKVDLVLKTPHSRKRKVGIDDLIGALEKALEVDKRRIVRKMREREIDVEIPEKKIDISKLIKNIFDRIKNVLSKKEVVMFSELIEDDKRENKIAIFVPLMYLSNQQKVDLNQREHFSDIEITLYESKDL